MFPGSRGSFLDSRGDSTARFGKLAGSVAALKWTQPRSVSNVGG